MPPSAGVIGISCNSQSVQKNKRRFWPAEKKRLGKPEHQTKKQAFDVYLIVTDVFAPAAELQILIMKGKIATYST